MKPILIVGGVIIAAFLLPILLVPDSSLSRAERVEIGCYEEFDTEDARRACFTEIMAREHLDRKQDALDRAADY